MAMTASLQVFEDTERGFPKTKNGAAFKKVPGSLRPRTRKATEFEMFDYAVVRIYMTPFAS